MNQLGHTPKEMQKIAVRGLWNNWYNWYNWNNPEKIVFLFTRNGMQMQKKSSRKGVKRTQNLLLIRYTSEGEGMNSFILKKRVLSICFSALMLASQLQWYQHHRNNAKIGDFLKHTREPRTSAISFFLLLMAVIMQSYLLEQFLDIQS